MMTRFLILAAGALAVAACSDGREQPPAPVVYQGSQPNQQAAAHPTPSGAPSQAPAPSSPSSEADQPTFAPQPVAAAPTAGVSDTRGVTFYDGYQTVTARQGDTVDSMARRVGIQGAELAAYNGLSTLYTPLTGDELVLPARADGYRGVTRVAAAAAPTLQPAHTLQSAPVPERSTGSGWSPALVTAAIEGTEEPVAAAQPSPQPIGQQSAEQTAALDAAAVNDPQPAPTLAPTVAAPQPQPETVLTTSAPKPVPAAARQPAPDVTQQAALAPAATPTVTAEPGKFIRPVNAPISRPFSKRAGPDRNDGVDFDSPAGAPVVAADSGTVVLVSRSLGGLGTIVLVRHENEFLTVYGRIDDVVVTKGDRVERGQVIAKVADLKPPRTSALHFEIRRGPESVDPEQFI